MTGRKTIALGLTLLTALSACGGGTERRVVTQAPPTLFAAGPLADACNRSPRPGASRSLCGCSQAVANRRLSTADQQLAVRFYSDLDLAQEVRQSDNPSNEAFWTRYKLYIADLRRYCARAA